MEKYAHWFIRIPFAATFIYHGAGKFFNLSGMAEMMGMPTFLLAIVGVAEVLAGLGAIVGGMPFCQKKDLVTRLAGLAAAPVMIGAIFMVHWPRFSFAPTKEFPMGGFEFQLLLLGVAIYFILKGNPDTSSQTVS